VTQVVCPGCGAVVAATAWSCPICSDRYGSESEFLQELALAVPLDAVRQMIRDATPASPEEAASAGPRRAEWIGLAGMWGLDPATLQACERLILATGSYRLAVQGSAATWSKADYERWWSERACDVDSPSMLGELTGPLLGYWYARKRERTQETCARRLRDLQVAPGVAESLLVCASWLDALDATCELLRAEYQTAIASDDESAAPDDL